MALKHPGKNAPLADDARQTLLRLSQTFDLAVPPERPTDIRLDWEVRPFTLDELTSLIQVLPTARRLSVLLKVPWDEHHAGPLADVAVRSDAHLAVVLLAGSGRHDEARALYSAIDPELVVRYIFGGGHAALAAGDFEVPAIRSVSHLRLSTMGDIVRFRPIADRLAEGAEALIGKLPDFFAGNWSRDKFVRIWTPTLRCFALLSDGDDKRVDEGYRALLAELAGVPVAQHESFTYEDKIAGLNTMFTLAMQQGRLLSAYRIASKQGKSKVDAYRIRVAVAYAKAGDLGGVWEIVGRMILAADGGINHRFEHLAQVLQGVAELTGEPTNLGKP